MDLIQVDVVGLQPGQGLGYVRHDVRPRQAHVVWPCKWHNTPVTSTHPKMKGSRRGTTRMTRVYAKTPVVTKATDVGGTEPEFV